MFSLENTSALSWNTSADDTLNTSRASKLNFFTFVQSEMGQVGQVRHNISTALDKVVFFMTIMRVSVYTP